MRLTYLAHPALFGILAAQGCVSHQGKRLAQGPPLPQLTGDTVARRKLAGLPAQPDSQLSELGAVQQHRLAPEVRLATSLHVSDKPTQQNRPRHCTCLVQPCDPWLHAPTFSSVLMPSTATLFADRANCIQSRQGRSTALRKCGKYLFSRS